MKGEFDFSTRKKIQNNEVLDDQYVPSQNFFESDRILFHHLKKTFSDKSWNTLEPHLKKLGETAAKQMDMLSLTADKNPPRLEKRNLFGETIDRILFHPSYWELVKIAVESGMFSVKWKPEAFKRNEGERHRMNFALTFVYGLAESGVCCPLCMTDGAAKIISKYADDEDRERLMKHFYTEKPEELFTGAMFLTEKSGGSDVGKLQVQAQKKLGKHYLLNGEKWFCSNANAEVKLVLARTGHENYGTKGLSLFLVEPQKANGDKNPMEIVRLKDKLGVRSMASAEIVFTDTEGKLIGKEGEGFKIMAEMINLSRIWNAVIALAAFRRCLIEAFQFLSHRHTFGKRAIDHALVRTKLFDLGAQYVADFSLTWKAIELLDEEETGDSSSKKILRLVTPLIKKQTAESAVYGIRECMELMGGLGYIEDGVLPKFMRDTLVLPIWEGTSNMMVLDFLRASKKTDGLQLVLDEIKARLNKQEGFNTEVAIYDELLKRLFDLSMLTSEEVEFKAKSIAKDLTYFIQLNLLLEAKDNFNAEWIVPSVSRLRHLLTGKSFEGEYLPTTKELIQLLAWKF